MKQEIFRMERVSCLEHGIVQLDGFNLNIFSSEIMGLLPINNHGLTALLQLIQRNTPLRYGYMYYREEQVNTWRKSKQRNNRIGLIQSESCLVEGLTVADNIFVLRPEFKTWLIKPSVLRKQLLPFSESIGIYISADTYVEELSPFEKVVVDVLKFVMAGCKLIVLRDICANICEAELKKIHRLLKHYADQGISFLYIDLHIEELKQVCDKVALMSNGRIVKVLQSDTSMPDVFQNYTKEYIEKANQQIYFSEVALRNGSPVFEAKGICAEIVNNLSFTACTGECLVLQNADVQLFEEFLSILGGENVQKRGKILINNEEITPHIGDDIAVIQELPTESMLFKEMSYIDNLCFLLDHRLPEIWRDENVRAGIRREYAAILGNDVFDKRIDALSEIQKYELIYMRIAIQKPKVVFCVQPFRRADMELRMRIWQLLKMLKEKNIAVVILAINLTDSLSLADRLIRIRKDKPNEAYLRSQFSSMSVGAPWVELYKEIR